MIGCFGIAAESLREARPVLGDLIAQLDRPGVAAKVMETLEPDLQAQLVKRADAASMSLPDFAAGAVREFAERAGDDLWFQLLTIVRKAEDPGLVAVQTILEWVVTEPSHPRTG
jgi:hypothetical protein